MKEENGEEKLGRLHGEWGLEKREQRLLYAEDRLVTREKEKEKPAIMARVTDVEAFFQMVSGGDSAAAGAEQSDGTAKKRNQSRTDIWRLQIHFFPPAPDDMRLVTDKAGGAKAGKTDEAREKQSRRLWRFRLTVWPSGCSASGFKRDCGRGGKTGRNRSSGLDKRRASDRRRIFRRGRVNEGEENG